MNTPNTPARFLVATLGVFLTASGCATLFGPRELAGSGEGAPAAPQPVAVPEPVRQLQAISAAATPTLATKAVRTYFGDIEAGRLVLPLDLRTEIDRALADNPYPRVQAARRRIVGRFTDEALASFSVVIVPLVSHLSDDQIAVLQRYVDADGALLIVGECGTHDELGTEREASSSGLVRGERVATAANLDDLVPRRAPESFDLSEDEINDYDHIVGLPDRVGSAEEAQAARDVPLIGELERLAGRRLRALADGAPYTLRMSMFEGPTGDRRVAHLVNYDLPVVGRGKSEAPIPARDVTVLTSAESAVYWTPEGVSGEHLTVDGDGIHVPEVHSYALIEIAGNDSP